MSQARLGPGRIHHCMRSIGQAELALQMMVERAQERKTFGRYLYDHGAVSDWIGRSRIEIEQARLLVLRAAWKIDKVGAKAAADDISLIKALIPTLQTTVVDRAMQTFGAMGISQIRLYLICGLKGVPYDMQMAQMKCTYVRFLVWKLTRVKKIQPKH